MLESYIFPISSIYVPFRNELIKQSTAKTTNGKNMLP